MQTARLDLRRSVSLFAALVCAGISQTALAGPFGIPFTADTPPNIALGPTAASVWPDGTVSVAAAIVDDNVRFRRLQEQGRISMVVGEKRGHARHKIHSSRIDVLGHTGTMGRSHAKADS